MPLRRVILDAAEKRFWLLFLLQLQRRLNAEARLQWFRVVPEARRQAKEEER
jgi:hypothetical protein